MTHPIKRFPTLCLTPTFDVLYYSNNGKKYGIRKTAIGHYGAIELDNAGKPTERCVTFRAMREATTAIEQHSAQIEAVLHYIPNTA